MRSNGLSRGARKFLRNGGALCKGRSGGGTGGGSLGTADTPTTGTSGQSRGRDSSSFQGFTNRTPSAVLAQVASDGESRAIKPANLDNARRNILKKGTQYHVVKIQKSGGIKDGWHTLNALAQLQAEGLIPKGSIRMELHD